MAGQPLWVKILTFAGVLGAIGLVVYWWVTTDARDADINKLGHYQIPALVCPNGEEVQVAFGYYGEEPSLFVKPGGRWEVPADFLAEHEYYEGDLSVNNSYLWVYCNNSEKSPSYTASNGLFFPAPPPVDGVLVVMEGDEPLP